MFCFALSPLLPTHPSNQLWLQAFSGLVASELAKDHQQCWSHNGIIVIVMEFCRFIRFPKAQQIETKSASLDGSNRGQNQQAQVCIPLRTAVSVGFSDNKAASVLQQQHSHQQEGALKMTASVSVQQPAAEQQQQSQFTSQCIPPSSLSDCPHLLF